MPVSLRELIKRLRLLGFVGPEAGGGHQYMRRGRQKTAIPNPHGSREIGDGLLRRILKQADISWEEFHNVK